MLLGFSAAGLFFACWVGYHLNWIHERHNAPVGFCIAQIGVVEPDGTIRMEVVPWYAPWPLNWLGEPGRRFLMMPKSLPKEEVDRIVALFPEADRDIDFVAVDPEKARECNQRLGSLDGLDAASLR